MVHMRISGIGPSPVILGQIKNRKNLKYDILKVQKQAKGIV